ncbi:replication protein A3 S homeolog [Xenopus laevis]|uniref:Replication protein A3 S homeolog n=2 Tax=Xenopus laevis TaxID=8355 RepID=Q6AZP5_XENLA|nr:replication protein A3 S homeolog [Xenopus laevis]AAH77497.1 Rpa3-prov protein [Xenopus laevis]OCT74033.1 hypothetical protein XELAEV_18032996mg [Xenopus laevis]
MADMFDASKVRINSSMLAQNVGSPVCFVGRVDKVHPTGTSIVLSDGAGKNATVEFNEPLEEEISGIIEVIGKVTPKATIMGVSYFPFRDDVSTFDLALYDEALKIIHEFPQYYPFGHSANE